MFFVWFERNKKSYMFSLEAIKTFEDDEKTRRKEKKKCQNVMTMNIFLLMMKMMINVCVEYYQNTQLWNREKGEKDQTNLERSNDDDDKKRVEK